VDIGNPQEFDYSTMAKRKVDAVSEAVDDVSETEPRGDGYFESYANLGIHEEMLRCRRTDAYLDAIQRSAPLLAGKAVLDVGYGTGVLAIACVRAGARIVYAVEASAVSACARAVVQKLGLEQSVIVMEGRMEDVELPEQVDVIVSEWMGCFMLYESMLDSVLRARDRWLVAGGCMLPRRARMWLSPYRDEEEAAERAAFWRDVHGIDMSCLAPIAQAELARKPQIEFALPQNVIADAALLLDLDLTRCKVEDVQSVPRTQFCVPSHVRAEVHAFVGHFDVELTEGFWLSTSPADEPTHWRQVIFYLDHPYNVTQDEAIHGAMSLKQAADNPRCWDITLEYGGDVVGAGKHTQRLTLDVSC
jgi:SAM-dependent methyltransferase